mgnify:CR=1 FL=1
MILFVPVFCMFKNIFGTKLLKFNLQNRTFNSSIKLVSKYLYQISSTSSFVTRYLTEPFLIVAVLPFAFPIITHLHRTDFHHFFLGHQFI